MLGRDASTEGMIGATTCQRVPHAFAVKRGFGDRIPELPPSDPDPSRLSANRAISALFKFTAPAFTVLMSPSTFACTVSARADPHKTLGVLTAIVVEIVLVP